MTKVVESQAAVKLKTDRAIDSLEREKVINDGSSFTLSLFVLQKIDLNAFDCHVLFAF